MTGTIETLPASPCSANSDLTVANVRSTYHEGSKAVVSSLQIPTVDDTHGSPTSQPAPKRARVDPQSFSDKSELPCPDLPDNIDLGQESAQDDRKQELLLRLQRIADQKARLTSTTPSVDNTCRPSPCSNDLPQSPESEVQFITAFSTPPKKTPPPRRSTRSKKQTRQPPMDNHSCPVIDVDDDAHVVKVTPKAKGKPALPSPRTSRRVSTRTPKPRLPHGDNGTTSTDRSSPMPSCMSKCKRFQFCKKLTSTLLKDRRAAPFSAPVKELWSPQYIPDYFNIITHPMDLGTIRKNLDTRLYIKPIKTDVLPFRFDVDKFANDIRLVFRNAIIYNKEGDFLHNDAHCLLEDFERTMKEQLPVLPRKEECSLPVSSTKKRKVASAPPRQNKSASVKGRRRGKSTDTTILLDNIDNDSTSKVSAGRSRKSKPSSQTAPSGGMSESELDAMSTDELKDRLQYLKSCREPVMARMPIPKGEGYLSRAALLYDIPISNNQIHKCVDTITNGCVAPEKMPALTQLINQCKNLDGTSASASLNPATGDFETELADLNNQSWRNIEAFLEKYVPKFKTVRSSTLGREFNTAFEVDSEMAMIRSKLADHPVVKPSAQSKQRIEKSKSFFSNKDCNEASSSDSSSDSDSDSSSGSSASDSSGESDSDSD